MFKAFSVLFLSLILARPALGQNSLIERLQAAEQSLVQVNTKYVKTMRPDGRTMSFERSGAGVILDPTGLIVTNTHIIVNAPHIYVTLSDGSELEADLVFADIDNDFSFIRVAAGHPLTPIKWADSGDVRLGQNVIAVGNSDLNARTLLAGQINSLVQNLTTGANEMIGLDLNLFRGDSGGAVFDERVRLLGIIAARDKNKERASYAIASNKIREQYVKYRRSMP